MAQETTIPWQEMKGSYLCHATVERDGFTVKVKMIEDQEHDWQEDRGTFSLRWQPGAIRNPAAKYDRSLCEWFVPETPLRERIDWYRDPSISEEDARRRAMRDLRRDIDIAAGRAYERADIIAVAVRAVAYRNGVKLGSATCGTVEIDYDIQQMRAGSLRCDVDVNEDAENAIHDALEEARSNLARLIGTA